VARRNSNLLASTVADRLALTPWLRADGKPDVVYRYIVTGHLPAEWETAERVRLARVAEEAQRWSYPDTREAGRALARALAGTGAKRNGRRRANRGLPGLAGWNTYGTGRRFGGSQDRYSYDLYAQSGVGRVGPGSRVQYSIAPVQSDYGRHRGYRLSIFPGQQLGHGHTGILPDGSEVGIHAAPLYHSPQAAVAAARKHAAKHGVVYAR
jgi:hypothetical protein